MLTRERILQMKVLRLYIPDALGERAKDEYLELCSIALKSLEVDDLASKESPSPARIRELMADPPGWDGIIGKKEFARLCAKALKSEALERRCAVQAEAIEALEKWRDIQTEAWHDLESKLAALNPEAGTESNKG